jgi:hypothetical protein
LEAQVSDLSLQHDLVLLESPAFVLQDFPHQLRKSFMQNITVNTRIARVRTNKFFTPAIALIILIVAILVFFGLRKPSSSDSLELIPITESALEQQYGLRVNLVAVTGAGGFVDVRLKIVDGEKAKLLIADKNNFPALLVNDNLILNAPDDTRSQEIIFDDDENLFILYVNSASSVKRGSQLRILFGDIVLEPIIVR